MNMRRILIAAVLAVAALAGCQPAVVPTITAVASTTKPGCKAVTTVTGKAAPAGALVEATLERQIAPGGSWVEWKWFETTTPSEGGHIIQVPISKTTGTYSLTYMAPNISQQPTTRLRIRGVGPGSVSAVSTSWYVTRPTCS